jgi:hypothetical protein
LGFHGFFAAGSSLCLCLSDRSWFASFLHGGFLKGAGNYVARVGWGGGGVGGLKVSGCCYLWPLSRVIAGVF